MIDIQAMRTGDFYLGDGADISPMANEQRQAIDAPHFGRSVQWRPSVLRGRQGGGLREIPTLTTARCISWCVKAG